MSLNRVADVRYCSLIAGRIGGLFWGLLGFRATASTLLNESGKWNSDAIEHALAHGESDKVRAVYHRGAHYLGEADTGLR
ncbi:MAG: hypothetical protein RL299_277 [Pseudomonadota bacterium]